MTLNTPKKNIMQKSKLYVELDYVAWKNDKGDFRREDGPAVVYSNGDTYWYLNNKCHREDGPAVEHSNGDTYWYLNGERHREDGPAIEYIDGIKSWYLNGIHYSKKEYNDKIKTLR